jgi:mono/diheme cytochrome c family protein
MDTLVLIDSVFIISERTPEDVPLPTDTMRAVAPPAGPPPPPARPPPPPARAQAEQTARELVTRGRNLVAAKGCTGCHVVAGKGGTVGPKLDGVIGRRGAPYVLRKLRNPRFDVASSVMPEYGLSDAEINAIVAYLQSLN